MTRPKRSLGQNFLIDANIQRKIVGTIGAGPEDEVLEIGPGQAALTRHLVGEVRRLVLVELDDDLAAALAIAYGGRPEVLVVQGNILEQSLEGLLHDVSRALIAGNIPYNITTPIIFHLLERDPRPRKIVLMIQREVAERIVAPPGSRAYGALSVGVQAVAEARLEFHVSPNVFRPRPDVESAVITIEPRPEGPVPSEEMVVFRGLTRACFTRRRKQMRRILRDAYGLSATAAADRIREAGADPADRPEALPPETFVQLARALGHLPRD